MQRRDTTPARINDTKTISPFDKGDNNQPARLSTTVAFRIILILF